MKILNIYITLMPVVIMGILNMIFCKTNILKKLSIPIDNYKVLKDKKRLFGDNKTWKGFIGYIIFGIISCIIWGMICEKCNLMNYFYINHDNRLLFNILIGAFLGLSYGLCELPNSFLKRRFDIKEGKLSNKKTKYLFFIYDQIDSIIGCGLVLLIFYKLTFIDFIYIILCGAITHIIVNLLLYVLKLRKNMF